MFIFIFLWFCTECEWFRLWWFCCFCELLLLLETRESLFIWLIIESFDDEIYHGYGYSGYDYEEYYAEYYDCIDNGNTLRIRRWYQQSECTSNGDNIQLSQHSIPNYPCCGPNLLSPKPKGYDDCVDGCATAETNDCIDQCLTQWCP